MSLENKAETLIHEHNRDFQLKEFDLKIQSTDRVVFKVHRVHLISSSGVFRDMFDGEELDGELALTDSGFENASTIKLFLEARNLFVLGYAVKKPDLATFAVSSCGCWTWLHRSCDKTEDEKSKSKNRLQTLKEVVGTSILDVSSLTLEGFKDIPDTYKFAFIRSTWGRINDEKLKKTEWNAIGDDFARLLSDIEK